MKVSHPNYHLLKRIPLLLGTAMLASMLVACSDDSDDSPDSNTPANEGDVIPGGGDVTPGGGDVTPGGGDVTPGGGGVTPPATEALSCTGNRVWTGGPSDTNPQIEELISEGGPQLGVPATSAQPCAIVWEYNASANCSNAFTVEGFFGEEVAPSLTLSITGGNLVISDGTNSETGPPSGISFQQLVSVPNC